MPQRGEESLVFAFDQFRLNPAQRWLKRGETRVQLTPRVFDLLLALVERHSEVVTKDELLDTVWRGTNVEEGNINRTVSTLRKQLGRQTDGSDFIETVPRVGYRFLANVETESTSNGYRPVAQNALPIGKADEPVRPRTLAHVLLGIALTIFAAGTAYLILRPAPKVDLAIRKNEPVLLLAHSENDLTPQFARDGTIRFARLENGISYSYRANPDGSDARRDVSIPGLRSGIWSPDGARVFFWREGNNENLYLANADGSDERALPFKAGNTSWSHDSTEIVFQSRVQKANGQRDFDIFVYSIADGTVKPIVEHSGFDGDPSFSPDGRYVLFVSDRDGNIEIYKLDRSDGSIVRLTDSPGHDSYPHFSPDGTQIVFNSDREKENADIYVMSPDGSNVKKVTDRPSNDFVSSYPWSADGTRLLILSDQGGADNVHQIHFEPFTPKPLAGPKEAARFPDVSKNGEKLIYVAEDEPGNASIRIYDLKSGRDAKVADLRKGGGSPKWSPDGERFVFADTVGDNTEIIISSTDGTERVNITNDPARDQAPVWSPDGEFVYFSSNRGSDRQRFSIWRVRPDGSDLSIVHAGSGSSVEPHIAPSGEILFADDSVGGRIGNFEIFKLSTPNSSISRLTDRKLYDFAPAVSPDGRKIAFVSNADGNFEIYVMNSDGSGLLRVTRDPADDLNPSWMPDSRTIVFSSNRSASYQLYELTLD